MGRIRRFPAPVILALIASALMLIPAIHATILESRLIARSFLYHSFFFAAIAWITGLATLNRKPRNPSQYYLMVLFFFYLLMPVLLAMPMLAPLPGLRFSDAYLEMLSALTTTGMSVFDRPGLLADPLNLWRSVVGWAGGYFILVSVFAILSPMNLGGFEIGQEGMESLGRHSGNSVEDTNRRILAASRSILPVYCGLTGVLAMILIVLGDRPFVGLSHAMATLSTSGISPVGGIGGAGSGRGGEFVLLLFLLPAVSHKIMFPTRRAANRPSLRDPEIQLMLISVIAITLLLLLRSLLAAAETARQDNILAMFHATWGSMFTVLSYLCTFGFESNDWRGMQLWSGLPDPGMLLLGVAMMGGGIATTAGGIKLLRIYAMYRHGLREMDLLIYPSSIGHKGEAETTLSERGPRIAFVFLMLFLVSLAIIMLALSATGIRFESSLTMAVSALTTTGPAVRAAGLSVDAGSIGILAQGVLGLGMIVGRMEVLVIVALFNPAFWRG